MNEVREFGIPSLRIRTDATEEAREWNKLVEAVRGLYSNRVERAPAPRIAAPVHPFTPVVYRDGGTNGVGLVPGKVLFHQTPIFYEAAGTDNRAIEVWPTLGGTALNNATPPRSSLAANDYESWIIYKEVTGAYEARVVFSVLGTGPGSLDRDEKCHRLCTFTVVVDAASVPHVRSVEQYVVHHFEVWTDTHQFRAEKTGTTTLNIKGGTVSFFEGVSDPVVESQLAISDSGNITVTGTGAIWLELTWGMGQLSQTSVVDDDSTPSSTYTLTMYRINYVSSTGFSFRSTVPTPGSDATNVWTGGGTLWCRICNVALSGGEVFVTDQIADGPIRLPDLTDGSLTKS